MSRRSVAAVAVILGVLAGAGRAADPVDVLLITGQNNHEVERTTAWMKKQLEATGRFAVRVAWTPSRNAPDEKWSSFRPDFDAYDTVLLNYNGEMWPTPVRKAFEAFVRGGGGAVVIHAANNPFSGWDAYNRMIGLGWRGPGFGHRVYVDEDGNVVRVPPGEGPGAGHGGLHPFPVTVRDPEHPVMEGMPRKWMQAKDELYHGQRGPAKRMHLLATAWSSSESGGTGKHEPVIWTVRYGKGTVLTCLLGHVWRDNPDMAPMKSVGFLTVLRRGCEWTGAGEVTLPVPENFPTAEDPSVVGSEGD